jgi:hypothetical protein
MATRTLWRSEVGRGDREEGKEEGREGTVVSLARIREVRSGWRVAANSTKRREESTRRWEGLCKSSGKASATSIPSNRSESERMPWPRAKRLGRANK